MSKRTLTLIVIVCLALLVTMLPFASACGKPAPTPAPAPAPATTPAQGPAPAPKPATPAPGQTLKVGVMTPTTGAAASKGAFMGHANLDAIEYINKELGGAGGYPIEAVWMDSGYDASKVTTIVKRFMDEKCLLFNTSSSTEMQWAMAIANRAGFPGLACFTSPIIYRPPEHIYGQMPDYGDDFLVFMDYYLKNIWKGQGKPKVALHMLNNPTGYGARDAAKAAADKMGIEVVAMEEHTATTISEIESLTRIKTKKPDVLYIASTPTPPTAVIIKNAVELGMYPGITIGLGHAAITKPLVDAIGADIAEGVYGTYPTVSWGDKVPGMAKMTEYVQKLHPKDEGNMDYISAWAQSLVVAEILRVAVKNAGYDVLSKGDAAAWKALETQGIQKVSNYDVAGLHGPASYTPGDNRLSKSLRVFQIKKGVITPITDWIEAPVVKYEDYDWFGK